MIILDVRCWNTSFASDVRWCNGWWGATFLCGEPQWYLPFSYLLRPIYSSRMVERIIKASWPGIFRVKANYGHFGLPASCLDLVTLNCASPFDLPRQKTLQAELCLCLKSGGYFIETNPVGRLTPLDQDLFEKISQGTFGGEPIHLTEIFDFDIEGALPKWLPPSQTMFSNVLEQRRRFSEPDTIRRSSGYMYAMSALTLDWVIWRKK